MSSVFQFSHVILIFMQRSSSRWAHNPRFYTAVIVAGIDDSRKENKGNKKIIFVKKKNSSLGRKSELHSCILSKLFFQNFQKSRFESETRRCFNLSQGNRNFSSPGKIREVVTRDKRGLTGRVEKILPPSFSRHQESLVSCSHFHPPPLSLHLHPPLSTVIGEGFIAFSCRRVLVSRLSCAVPSYLCNGCTTGHGSRQGNVFSAKKRSPPPSKANVYAFGFSLKFSREKKKKKRGEGPLDDSLSLFPPPIHRSPRLRRVHDDDFVMGHACYREA